MKKEETEFPNIWKIKIGNPFWLSKIGMWISGIGILFFILFFAILYTGKPLPAEMKLIYYAEIMHRYVYYGFGLSIITSVVGFILSGTRKWITTDLIIDRERIEFTENGKNINLPRQKILKLIRLKSYFFKDNKVRIRTFGLKKYLIRMDDSLYNELIDVYADRFYEK